MSKHKGNKYRPNTNGAVVQAPGQTNDDHQELKRAKELLSSGRPPRDRSEQMIANNYRAMQYIRTDLGGSRRGPARIAAGNDDIAAERCVTLCQSAADSARATDDQYSDVQSVCRLLTRGHQSVPFCVDAPTEFLFFNCSAK